MKKFFYFSVTNRLKESDRVGDQREDLQLWWKGSGFSSPSDILSVTLSLMDYSRRAIDQRPFQQTQPISFRLP
jgi:hypothetical protein